jgi:tetratricopeptide (TPR) repeat protein
VTLGLPGRLLVAATAASFVLAALSPSRGDDPSPSPIPVPSSSPDEAQQHLIAAAHLIDQGYFGAAIEEYSAALALDPRYGAVYVARGSAYAQLQEFAQARDDFTSAIALGADLKDAYLDRGTMNGQLGDTQAAIADFQHVLVLDPKDAAAHYGIGVARETLGDLTDAIVELDLCIADDPSYGLCYAKRGMLRAKRGEVAASIDDYTKAISLMPGDSRLPQLYFERAVERNAAGDRAGALDDLKNADLLAVKAGDGTDAILIEQTMDQIESASPSPSPSATAAPSAAASPSPAP